MASAESSSSHFKPGTVITKLCIRAMGSEFEFMNMDAAMAKALIRIISTNFGFKRPKEACRCDFFSLMTTARKYATIMDTRVVTTKNMGMIHSSRSFAVAEKSGLVPCGG